jgi:hypothetical protein
VEHKVLHGLAERARVFTDALLGAGSVSPAKATQGMNRLCVPDVVSSGQSRIAYLMFPLNLACNASGQHLPAAGTHYI